jgi:hypothetical protein
MPRYLLATIMFASACVAQAPMPADAGRIIFVAGKASVADQPAVDGAACRKARC